MKTVNFIIRLIVAVILLQTLRFKFGAAEESIYLFSKIVGDQEAYLRITTGVLELIASILLLIPRTQVLGALKVLGIMSGAILSHMLFLGFDSLFALACIAFAGAAYTLWTKRKEVNFLNLLT